MNHVLVITVTSPFGWIAGKLSEANRILPFVLIIALSIAGGLLVYVTGRLTRAKAAVESAVEAVAQA